MGLLAFILYLPGGMAQLMHRLGDAVTGTIEAARRRRGGEPDGALPATEVPTGPSVDKAAVSSWWAMQ